MRRRHMAMLSTPLTTIALLLALPVPGAHAAVTSGSGPSVLRVSEPGAPRVLHARHVPETYQLRPGDYLYKVAQRECGNGDDWLGIWHATRPHIVNPNLVPAGLRVTIACNHRGPGYYPPAPAHRASARHHSYRHLASSGRHSSSRASYGASGSFESCVIARESGGNASAVNSSSGAGGLYQFLPSTWRSLGYSGRPQDAPVSVQREAFQRLYAQAGTSPWGPYDGC